MILGHERQIAYFQNILKKGTLAHAYLFSGPEHIGKFTVAESIARALICNDGKVLGETCACRDCQAVLGGVHPQALLLRPDCPLKEEKKEKRKEISIDDIRELRRRFSLRAESGRWRVAIIDDAEKMSQEASNALLKTLEEPGAETVFFLITSSRALLLPTIVSRAQPLLFSLLSEGILADYLKKKGISDDTAKELLWFAAGRPGILIRMLEDKDFLEAERKFSKSFMNALGGGVPESLRFSETYSKDEVSCAKTYGYLLRYLRDQMLKSPVVASAYSASTRIKKVERIAGLLDTTNVNPRLALDCMFLEVLQS